jgi:hypothetical protein
MLAIFTASSIIHPGAPALEPRAQAQALLRLDERFAMCWIETMDDKRPIAAGQTGLIRVRAMLSAADASNLVKDARLEIYGDPQSPWAVGTLIAVEQLIRESHDP